MLVLVGGDPEGLGVANAPLPDPKAAARLQGVAAPATPVAETWPKTLEVPNVKVAGISRPLSLAAMLQPWLTGASPCSRSVMSVVPSCFAHRRHPRHLHLPIVGKGRANQCPHTLIVGCAALSSLTRLLHQTLRHQRITMQPGGKPRLPMGGTTLAGHQWLFQGINGPTIRGRAMAGGIRSRWRINRLAPPGKIARATRGNFRTSGLLHTRRRNRHQFYLPLRPALEVARAQRAPNRVNCHGYVPRTA